MTRFLLPILLPLLLLPGCAALMLAGGGPFYSMWVQDVFVPLGAAEHVLAGHRPFVDVHAPLGPLYWYVQAGMARLFGVSASNTVGAGLLVGWVAAGLVLWAGRDRLPPWLAGVLAAGAGLVALSPRQLGHWPDAVSHNAAYNRYGWALFMPLCLLLALPRRDARPGWDGALAGLLLVLLLLTKVTYAPVGIGLAGLSFLVVQGRGRWRFAAGGVAAGLAALAVFELGTGLLLPYAAEVRRAASVQADPVRWGQFVTLLLASVPGAAVVACLAGLVRPGWRRIAMAGATVLAGVLIGTQNHLAAENPLLPAAAAAVLAGAGAGGRRALPGAVLVLGLAAVPAGLDVAAVGWSAAAPVSADPALRALDGTPLTGLRLQRAENRLAETGTVTNDVEYVALLGEGLALLRPHLRPGSTVLPLTWTNPFAVLLRLPPPVGELLWWDEGRSFSSAIHPDPARLLGGVDLVMVPSTYPDYRTTAAMRRVYAEALDRDFVTVDRSAHWTLLGRR